MQNDAMRVSVVIPVWNRSRTVGLAIDSILRQDFAGDVDVVLVDDASSDDLASAVAGYGDRVRVVRHAVNKGAAAARNTGIASVKCGYVALLDSDDIWLSNKLSAQLAFMNRHQLAVSATSYILRHDDGAEGISPWYSQTMLGLKDLVWGCFVSPGSTLVFKRALFDEVGPFRVDMKRLEDWDWLLRVVARYPLGLLHEPLARITPSVGKSSPDVLTALNQIYRDYARILSPRQRRHFLAAVRFERAAYYLRNGMYVRGMGNLIASLGGTPFGHDARAAVLYNRRQRRLL
jgi:glycosyltransferase involved in cell wall biosynthesis